MGGVQLTVTFWAVTGGGAGAGAEPPDDPPPHAALIASTVATASHLRAVFRRDGGYSVEQQGVIKDTDPIAR